MEMEEYLAAYGGEEEFYQSLDANGITLEQFQNNEVIFSNRYKLLESRITITNEELEVFLKKIKVYLP
ncbi:hypothetical protein KHA80_21400 [Anaerobacillus sp. HL2]|nr:hypothetical protein KHA80_21400 [Anaerobacillus sp. HL2]